VAARDGSFSFRRAVDKQSRTAICAKASALYGPSWPGVTDFNVEPAARIDDLNAPIDRGNLAQGFVGYRRGHQDFNVTD
jgi:hypothetical protein